MALELELPARKVPVSGEYDVVVVGGGTAGAVAGISSAREGARTVIIEQFGSLGGSQTIGLVHPMMHTHIEGNPFSSAIDAEICDRMIESGFGLEGGGGNKGWFDPQMLKIVLEEMATEAGCDLLYHTTVSDVLVREGCIEALLVHNKGGTSAIKAGRVIDCSGDADVAYLAGLEVQSGDEEGYNQAVSLRFQMTNVDLDRFGQYLESIGQQGNTSYPVVHTASVRGADWPLNKLFAEKHKEGLLAERDLNYFQVFSVPGRPRDLAFNCPELGAQKNVLDPEFMSRKQVEGKQAIRRLVKFLQTSVPGFEEAYVCDMAAMVNVRESRRIVGEYQLTKDDILQYTKFPDGIARTNYPLDIHGGKDDGLKFAETGIAERFYEVPYRSLVAKGVDNLLAAGRCIAADFIAQSSLRIQPTCRAMGEAAGIAAALSLQDNCPCRSVNGKRIREKMRARGAWL